jgi:hypothetical protein
MSFFESDAERLAYRQREYEALIKLEEEALKRHPLCSSIRNWLEPERRWLEGVRRMTSKHLDFDQRHRLDFIVTQCLGLLSQSGRRYSWPDKTKRAIHRLDPASALKLLERTISDLELHASQRRFGGALKGGYEPFTELGCPKRKSA